MVTAKHNNKSLKMDHDDGKLHNGRRLRSIQASHIILGVSPIFLYKKIEKEKWPVVRLGNKIFFKQEFIEALCEKGEDAVKDFVK